MPVHPREVDAVPIDEPLKKWRVTYTTRVAPKALQQLQTYARQQGMSQADVVASALNLFFRSRNLDEVA
jgi:hypothetical protein